jgi:hypothetical protein
MIIDSSIVRASPLICEALTRFNELINATCYQPRDKALVNAFLSGGYGANAALYRLHV